MIKKFKEKFSDNIYTKKMKIILKNYFPNIYFKIYIREEKKIEF